MPSPIKWSAAVWAGIAAGIVSSAVEIVLWRIFADTLPQILYRDTRFAAALVLGPQVLGRTGPPDAHVVVAATIVHFTLSVVYAIVLARLIVRLHAGTALLAGAIFGAVLYAINMYGFTAIFPWFAADRDAITAIAHVVFGVVAAECYMALRGT
jgi:hypothetical protein